MAQKKLGRGLGALVSLAPASDDGTARLDEAIRAAPPEDSVLALSGRSVEDYFRVAGVEAVAPPARPVPPAPPPPEPPAGSVAPIQESCSDPEPVDDLPAADEEGVGATAPDPATVTPAPDEARQFLLFDPAVEESRVTVAGGTGGDADAPPAPVPARAMTASVATDAQVTSGAAAAPRTPSAIRPAAAPPAAGASAAAGATLAPSSPTAAARFDGPASADVAAPWRTEATPPPSAPVGPPADVPETGGGFVDDVMVVDEFVVADVGSLADAEVGSDGGSRVPAGAFAGPATVAAPTPAASPAPSREPGPPDAAPRPAPTLLVDDVVILDDAVGGIVLPDVELE